MNTIGIFLLILIFPSLRVRRITSSGTLALIIDLSMEGRVCVLAESPIASNSPLSQLRNMSFSQVIPIAFKSWNELVAHFAK